MTTRQGFKALGITLDEFAYQENSAGYSASIGLDYSGNVFNINILNVPGANPSSGNPQISIDPVGDVTITSIVNGDVQLETTGTGDVNIFTSGGDIVLDQDGGNLQVIPFSTGVVQSNSIGVLKSTTGTNGQILIAGDGGVPPVWANITSVDNSVTIADGVNSIDLSVSGTKAGSNSFQGKSNQMTVALPAGMNTYTLGTNGGTLSALFDNSGGFYGGDGGSSPCTWTAPRTGIYMLTLQTTISSVNANMPFAAYNAQIVTTTSTGRTYQFGPNGNYAYSPRSSNVTALLQMTVGDVATFVLNYNTAAPAFLLGYHNDVGVIAYDLWVNGFQVA
jgi:hypothetical protein